MNTLLPYPNMDISSSFCCYLHHLIAIISITILVKCITSLFKKGEVSSSFCCYFHHLSDIIYIILLMNKVFIFPNGYSPLYCCYFYHHTDDYYTFLPLDTLIFHHHIDGIFTILLMFFLTLPFPFINHFCIILLLLLTPVYWLFFYTIIWEGYTSFTTMLMILSPRHYSHIHHLTDYSIPPHSSPCWWYFDNFPAFALISPIFPSLFPFFIG